MNDLFLHSSPIKAPCIYDATGFVDIKLFVENRLISL
jgi:hypothetical protein